MAVWRSWSNSPAVSALDRSDVAQVVIKLAIVFRAPSYSVSLEVDTVSNSVRSSSCQAVCRTCQRRDQLQRGGQD